MIQTARLTALSALLLCLAACNSPESDSEAAPMQEETVIVTEEIAAPSAANAACRDCLVGGRHPVGRRH